ncbi:Arm DNA-binding domain-containing protein [Pedobacter sp. NJ-S-72]
MRITVNGKRSEVTTGRKCEHERWNTRAGRVLDSKEECKSLNSYLDHLQNQIYNAHESMFKSGELINAETIKYKFLGKKVIDHTLMEAVKDHNSKMKALVGKEFAYLCGIDKTLTSHILPAILSQLP